MPKPLNLPSLRKEHGSNPTAQLVPFGGNISRWSKSHQDIGDIKNAPQPAVENRAGPTSPDAIVWGIKGACEMRAKNHANAYLKSRVEEQSTLNAHEYPLLGSETNAETGNMQNQPSWRFSSKSLQSSRDAIKFESRRWQEDEREHFLLSENRPLWCVMLEQLCIGLTFNSYKPLLILSYRMLHNGCPSFLEACFSSLHADLSPSKFLLVPGDLLQVG